MGILLHSSHRNGEFRVSNPICPIHSQAKESFPEGVTCIPIPFNPIDPTPYTSSFGDLLSQPFFHDDTEVISLPHFDSFSNFILPSFPSILISMFDLKKLHPHISSQNPLTNCVRLRMILNMFLDWNQNRLKVLLKIAILPLEKSER
jgi:hypothetical protein